MEHTLRDLQLVTVDILVEFDRICQEYGLTYYLGFGTLLGAVRHKGYIPWDDDIDLCMPRKDFDKFVQVAYKKVHYPFQVCYHTMDNYTSFSFNFRVENSRVCIVRNIGGIDKELPAWISVFPIDGLPKKKVQQKRQERIISYLYTLLRFARSAKNGYGKSDKNILEKIGVVINKYLRIGKLLEPRKMARAINNQLRKFDYDMSDQVFVYTFNKYKSIYEKKWFDKPQMIEFEGKLFPAPSDYDAFLKRCYGDYMKLPPVEQRKPSHSVDFIFKDSSLKKYKD
jgi:lipopolysaccharide cholinephosphotransferase